MREIDSELQARLDSGTTTLCRCWQLRRQDGAIFGFTDHDADLRFEGTDFVASSGFDAGALEISTGLSVDNGQIAGALSAAAVTDEDILAGRYDNAEVSHWLVDWDRPDLRVLLFRGALGEITQKAGQFEAELRGLADQLNQPMGRAFIKSCECVLGDAKCGLNLTSVEWGVEAVATAASDQGQVVLEGLASFAEGWFDRGVVTWLTGANAGATAIVRFDKLDGDFRRIILWQEARLPVAPGDTLRLDAGCDKTASTCRDKFNNFLNFRGFPHIPGDDWVAAYPTRGGANTGLSLFGE